MPISDQLKNQDKNESVPLESYLYRIYEEQQRQTSLLKNVSLAANIYVLLAILGFLAVLCSFAGIL